jgi:hypothetical protein
MQQEKRFAGRIFEALGRHSPSGLCRGAFACGILVRTDRTEAGVSRVRPARGSIGSSSACGVAGRASRMARFAYIRLNGQATPVRAGPHRRWRMGQVEGEGD